MTSPKANELLQELVDLHLQRLSHLPEIAELRLNALRFGQRALSKSKAIPRSVEIIQKLQRKVQSNDFSLRLIGACQDLRMLGADEAALLHLLTQLHNTKDLLVPETRPALPANNYPRGPLQAAMGRINAGANLTETPQAARKSLAGRQQKELSKAMLSKSLVREVLYACQAVSGKHIQMPADDNGNFLIDPALGAPTPERQLMLKLAELGWLFRRLRSHVAFKQDGQSEGAVRQAFQGALRQELADFYRLLASLEAQAENELPEPGEENRGVGSYLTLRRLLVWLGEPLVRMKWLAAIADSAADAAGGQLLATLEAAAAHGQPIVRNALLRCLKLAAVPYLSQIWLWVFQGRLQPSLSSAPEFFIVRNLEHSELSGHGKLWRQGYKLEESMRSPFISKPLANRILRAGKSLNFLREYCTDTEWTQQAARTSLASTAATLQFDQAEALESVVTQAGADIDKHVVDVLLDKFALGAHCGAIKRYLLLCQGDFVEALMESVGAELSRPASEISEFSLNGNLDAAIRASSAQYDAADETNRLRIRIDVSQQNDIGWEVFVLKYDVAEPIATVLDDKAMKAYLQIFRLLWALKRAEHSLNACWTDLNSLQRQLSSFPGYVKKTGLPSYSMERVWEDLRQCHRLRNEMAHLINSWQAYIMFEVVEAAWTAFMERLKTTQDLDGLIQAHEEYLHSLLRKTLLEDPEKVTPADKASSLAQPSLKQKFPPHVQLELRSLVQSTLELRPRIRSLTDVVNAACFKARRHVHNAILAEARGEWGSDGLRPTVLGVAPDDLDRVHIELDALDRNYCNQLGKFVELLPGAAHVDLRFLLFRLEAGGKTRTTEDGARSRATEDGSMA